LIGLDNNEWKLQWSDKLARGMFYEHCYAPKLRFICCLCWRHATRITPAKLIATLTAGAYSSISSSSCQHDSVVVTGTRLSCMRRTVADGRYGAGRRSTTSRSVCLLTVVCVEPDDYILSLTIHGDDVDNC